MLVYSFFGLGPSKLTFGTTKPRRIGHRSSQQQDPNPSNMDIKREPILFDTSVKMSGSYAQGGWRWEAQDWCFCQFIKRFRVFQYTYLKSMPVHSLLFQLACHVVNARLEKYPLRKQGPHPNLFGAVMQKPE
jgi:hypothetical protein